MSNLNEAIIAAAGGVPVVLSEWYDRPMTDKKTEISDRERERRAKQQAQQQQKHGGPPGQSNKQGGYNPANVVQRVTKNTGRGT